MTGNLDEAITALLRAALPGLLGGGTPSVTLSVQSDAFATDPAASEAPAGDPRPDDQVDQFAFDPAGIVFDSADPAYDPALLPRFTLSKPPYLGPRRVRLLTTSGDRIALSDREVRWDELDTRSFILHPAPRHDLAGVNGVQVLYGVIAVFTLVKVNQGMSLLLQSADDIQLQRCAALAVGVIDLHRQELLDNATAIYDDGDYRTAVKISNMKLLAGSSPAVNQRRLQYQVEVELKTVRALRDDEGRPITRVRTPGRPLDPARPVDIEIGVEA